MLKERAIYLYNNRTTFAGLMAPEQRHKNFVLLFVRINLGQAIFITYPSIRRHC